MLRLNKPWYPYHAKQGENHHIFHDFFGIISANFIHISGFIFEESIGFSNEILFNLYPNLFNAGTCAEMSVQNQRNASACFRGH